MSAIRRNGGHQDQSNNIWWTLFGQCCYDSRYIIQYRFQEKKAFARIFQILGNDTFYKVTRITTAINK